MYFKGAGVIFKTLISLEITQLFSRFTKNGKNLKKTKKMVLTKTIEYGIINKLVYSGNTNILLGGIETMRVQVILECTETKLRHYVTTKNKKTHPERIQCLKDILFTEKLNNLIKIDRSVVQLVERRSPKPKVAGSIPAWPAILFYENFF